MKHTVLLVLLVGSFSINTLYAQMGSQRNSVMDWSIKENILMNDTSFVNIVSIPFLSFDFEFMSDPGIYSFFQKNANNVIVDLQAYKNNTDNVGHHLLDIRNHLLYYAFRQEQAVYSFGLDHRVFAEFSFSKELISLLIDGNYQYLNQTLFLDDSNYGRALSYFSIFVGYSKTLQDQFSLHTKFKLIKGVASVGLDNHETSILFSDNFGTSQNPFSAEFNVDGTYFINSDYKPFSNLGFAVDLYFDYDYNDNITFYTKVNDLGFVIWKENQYYQSEVEQFDGIHYNLDQVLSDNFNDLQIGILDAFNDSIGVVSELRLLPFDIHLGANYIFNNANHQLSIDYKIQNLYHSFLHTGRISYLYDFEEYDLALIPSYSFNKFTHTNLSLFLNKTWKKRLLEISN